MPIAIGNISNLPTANISNVLATQVHISTDYITKQRKSDRNGRFFCYVNQSRDFCLDFAVIGKNVKEKREKAPK